MNTTRIGVTLACATFAALAYYYQGASEGSAPMPTAQTAALTVSEVVVAKREWPVEILATGPITAWQEAVVGSEVSGLRLLSLTAEVGDQVVKGQTLARYDEASLASEYTELEANWVTAKASARRALALKDSGAISDQEVETSVNQATVAKAKLAAKALQLQRVAVLAPDDGVISKRLATLGAVGAPGDELFRIIRQNRLTWCGSLTAQQATRIRTGQRVALSLPDGTQARGQVRHLAPSVDPNTRMATLFVDLQPGSNALPGMFAEGRIILASVNSLVVPAKSVVVRDGRPYVFALQFEQSGVSARQIEIQIGQTAAGLTQILAGLAEGDRVVLLGAGFLNDGDLVQLAREEGA